MEVAFIALKAPSPTGKPQPQDRVNPYHRAWVQPKLEP